MISEGKDQNLDSDYFETGLYTKECKLAPGVGFDFKSGRN